MPFASTAILICCKLTVPHLFAEEGDPITITTESVVARMVQSNHTRDLQLRDYTSVRHYSLRNQRFDTRATMTVRMTYRFPGQKRFEVMEESGPPTVRKKVLRRMLESELEASRDVARRESTQITPANYTFRLVGSETVSGRQCFVLQADPKTRNQFLFKGRLWVDSDDYAVTRIEGTPAQNPSIWLRKTTFVHRYEKFGPFWLAVSNESQTEVLVFGHTEVRIEYSNYRINEQE